MDFTDLGKHCHFCKQQDYLPIKCTYCGKYCCSTHASNHNCLFKKDNIVKFKKKERQTKFKCSKCKKGVYDDITCRLCKKQFCIADRHPELHNCVVYHKNLEYNKKRLMEKRLHSKIIKPNPIIPKSRAVTKLSNNSHPTVVHSCCIVS